MVRSGPIRWKTEESACILAPCVCKGSDPLICPIDRHFGVLNVSDVFCTDNCVTVACGTFRCPPGRRQVNPDFAGIRTKNWQPCFLAWCRS